MVTLRTGGWAPRTCDAADATSFCVREGEGHTTHFFLYESDYTLEEAVAFCESTNTDFVPIE